MLISQVYNMIPMDLGTSFRLQCPGHHSTRPVKMVMLHDGKVTRTRYQDVCQERVPVTLAYNDDDTGHFQIDRDTNSMLEHNGREDFHRPGIIVNSS